MTGERRGGRGKLAVARSIRKLVLPFPVRYAAISPSRAHRSGEPGSDPRLFCRESLVYRESVEKTSSSDLRRKWVPRLVTLSTESSSWATLLRGAPIVLATRFVRPAISDWEAFPNPRGERLAGASSHGGRSPRTQVQNLRRGKTTRKNRGVSRFRICRYHGSGCTSLPESDGCWFQKKDRAF